MRFPAASRSLYSLPLPESGEKPCWPCFAIHLTSLFYGFLSWFTRP